MTNIRFDHVTKRFADGTVAVRDLTLEVFDGEFMILLGPSGCGKTTALRMVAGLESATEGDIFLGQRRVNDVEAADRDVAMVFQNHGLFPHMTVAENIGFPLKMRRRPRSEVRNGVADATRLLGLIELLQRWPRELSGGQRQRVAMGRAIVRHPSVFLLDEPLSSLDAKLRTQMRKELSKLHQRLGVTTLYVTHDQVEAMTLGSRIAVMKDGVVQQVGAPAQVYGQPANVFVARFIGSPPMSLLGGTLSNASLNVAGFEGPLLLEDLRQQSDTEVVVGVRPEAWQLGAPPEARDVLSITGAVDAVEHLGAETLLYVSHPGLVVNGGDEEADDDRSFVVRVAGTVELRPNDQVRLFADAPAVHVFDAVSGQAVRTRDGWRDTAAPTSVAGSRSSTGN
jgi:multiple sugar transport system ATP-binding protein